MLQRPISTGATEIQIDNARPEPQTHTQVDVNMTTDNSFGCTDTHIDMQGLNGPNPQRLDSHDRASPFQWGDMSLTFDTMSPSGGYDFPRDLWFPGDDLQSFESPGVSPLAGTEKTQAKSSGAYYINPYVNSPFVHRLDSKGTPMRLKSICNFLKNQESWKQIAEVSARSEGDKRVWPKVHDQTRDALVAMTHIILSKALEQEPLRRMTLSFPPLETIQCLFRSCFNRFVALYPIIHPSTFDVTIEDQDEGLAFPIFLQSIMIMGALVLPVQEARSFAMELALLTRRAMHDAVVKDALITDDVWMLSSTILITAFGAWSGNKKLTELAEGYRGSYTVVGSNEHIGMKQVLTFAIDVQPARIP